MRMKDERASGLLLSIDDVLQKYIDIAFADIGDYAERSPEGFSIKVRPLEEIDSSIISELSNTENGIKMKMADRMKALDSSLSSPTSCLIRIRSVFAWRKRKQKLRLPVFKVMMKSRRMMAS